MLLCVLCWLLQDIIVIGTAPDGTPITFRSVTFTFSRVLPPPNTCHRAMNNQQQVPC
jgi:hypothetical protein